MEIQQVQALVLDIYTDEVLNLCYLKVLTRKKYESLKLPTSWHKYKFNYLIRPNYLLDLEIIKTRKNWIIKDILGFEPFLEPKIYQDFLKLRQIQKILISYLYEGQEVEIFDWLKNFLFTTSFRKLNLLHFENELKQKLGFA